MCYVVGDTDNSQPPAECANVTCAIRRQLIGCSRPLLAPGTCCPTCGAYIVVVVRYGGRGGGVALLPQAEAIKRPSAASCLLKTAKEMPYFKVFPV